MVKNILEELILLKLEKTMDHFGICTCEICKDDVMAFALNNLQPRYASSTGGDVMIRFGMNSEQGQAELLTAISKGIERVKNNPRHEPLSQSEDDMADEDDYGDDDDDNAGIVLN